MTTTTSATTSNNNDKSNMINSKNSNNSQQQLQRQLALDEVVAPEGRKKDGKQEEALAPAVQTDEEEHLEERPEDVGDLSSLLAKLLLRQEERSFSSVYQTTITKKIHDNFFLQNNWNKCAVMIMHATFLNESLCQCNRI